MEPVHYEIDRNDQLRLVGGGWAAFAAANGSPHLGRDVIGRRIWDYIDGSTTKQIYESLMARARSGHSVMFHYRCDSPEQRRYMRMRMHPAAEDGVRFESDTLVVRRWPGPRRAFAAERAGDPLRVCSWCKRVAVDGRWEEPEVAVDRFGMFVGAHAPWISHAICDSCYSIVERELQHP